MLPLDPGSVRSIALVGRLAGAANLGDHGSSDVRPPSSVSPYDGLRAAFPEAEIRLVQSDDVDEARRAAAESDVAIVVAGYTAADEGEFIGPDSGMTAELLTLFPPIPQSAAALLGEAFAPENEDHGTGGDRVSLALRPQDEDLIRAVAAANPRTVVAIVAAGAVLTESWRAGVPAVVMMWYAGMEGGHALADVLRGAQNPSGRLPFSIPTSEAHLPSFDREATAITYDHFHGQRLLDRLGVSAAFPHGYGLSYTSYEVRRAEVRPTEDGSRVRVGGGGQYGSTRRHPCRPDLRAELERPLRRGAGPGGLCAGQRRRRRDGHGRGGGVTPSPRRLGSGEPTAHPAGRGRRRARGRGTRPRPGRPAVAPGSVSRRGPAGLDEDPDDI